MHVKKFLLLLFYGLSEKAGLSSWLPELHPAEYAAARHALRKRKNFRGYTIKIEKF